MANLKDIRRRIKSVKNTQKITQAMRMVAAAKVKRAENKVKAIRPYSAQLEQLLLEVAGAAQQHLANEPDAAGTLKWLTTPTGANNPAIVVMSSDRGLCGAFNGTIIRQALKLEKHLLAQGKTPVFYTIGRKVTQAMKRYGKSTVIGTMVDMTAAPTSMHAKDVVDTLSKAYLAGDVDDIVVLSTHFRSMISYKVQLTSLLPTVSIPDPGVYPAELLAVAPTSGQATVAPREQLIEPDPVTVLNALVPLYLTNQLYTLLLESAASELAARMTAMANATTNASEMIGKLTIQYNKVRQAAITQEILEIVSGAQALA